MKKNKICFLSCVFLASYLSASEISAELDKVVISATGFEQDADSNLRNVVLIQGKDLQEKGYTSLEQALERISGVSFVDSGMGDNIDLRGQGSKSNVSVKVMVDGRSINVLDNSHGVTPLNAINLENVERIEIIPGGGSVLYGNGTRGGVINIITKKQKKDYFAINVKGSGYDHGNVGGDLGLNFAKKINDTLSFSFDIQAFNKDGYQEGYNQKGYFSNLKTYLDFEDSSLVFAYNYFTSQNSDTGYLSKKQIEENPKQKGASDSLSKINRPELNLDYYHYVNDFWEFNFSAYWQEQKIQYLRDISTASFMGFTVPIYQSGSEFEDTLSGIALKTKLNYQNNSYLVLGYELANHDAKRKSIVHYDVNSPKFNMSHTMTTLMDMSKQSHSIFALDSHELNDYFSISSGFRYEYSLYDTHRNYLSEMTMQNRPMPSVPELFDTDDKSKNFAFELTPSYKYSDTGLLYLKYERGFISPTPAQLVSKDLTSKKYYTSNLDAETFNTFELGMSDFWWDFYGVDLTLFYTQSKNEISYLGDPHSKLGAWWKYYNIDQTRRLGMELNLDQSFFDDTLTLKQNLTFLDAKISKGVNDGLRIPYVSKIKIGAGLDYIWSNNFSSFVDLAYFSRAKDSGTSDPNTGKMSKNQWIKDYFITDIGAKYHYKNLQIYTGIRNLFDKQYYTYQNAFYDQYKSANGRNYYLEFKYVF